MPVVGDRIEEKGVKIFSVIVLHNVVLKRIVSVIGC